MPLKGLRAGLGTTTTGTQVLLYVSGGSPDPVRLPPGSPGKEQHGLGCPRLNTIPYSCFVLS